METSAPLACPSCGFRVFNRRYPKCESCGAVLPESIAYTPAERASLFEAERLERELHEREQKDKEGDGAPGLQGDLATAETFVRASGS